LSNGGESQRERSLEGRARISRREHRSRVPDRGVFECGRVDGLRHKVPGRLF
jgi:hypothetical protein